MRIRLLGFAMPAGLDARPLARLKLLLRAAQ